MSVFLGPIHYRLFNKIQILEERRERYIQALEKEFGDRASALVEAMEQDYGPRLAGRPLDQLMGNQPIHGFLQSLIQKVEAGEGSLVAGAIEAFNGEAFGVLLEEAERHGRDVGERAVKEKSAFNPGAEDIQGALNDYLLEGMPCDRGGRFAAKPLSGFEWRHTTCPHRADWDSAGAPFMEMCCFTNAWIGGFVKAISPDMTFERNTSLASGDSGCLAVFDKVVKSPS